MDSWEDSGNEVGFTLAKFSAFFFLFVCLFVFCLVFAKVLMLEMTVHCVPIMALSMVQIVRRILTSVSDISVGEIAQVNARSVL